MQMKPQEAIEWCEQFRDNIIKTGVEKEKYTLALRAMRTAITAIEKQMPKKPTYVDTRFRNHGRSIADGASLSKCYKCPNCTSHIFHVWDSEQYCPYCGQALDWGKEDGK